MSDAFEFTISEAGAVQFQGLTTLSALGRWRRDFPSKSSEARRPELFPAVNPAMLP